MRCGLLVNLLVEALRNLLVEDHAVDGDEDALERAAGDAQAEAERARGGGGEEDKVEGRPGDAERDGGGAECEAEGGGGDVSERALGDDDDVERAPLEQFDGASCEVEDGVLHQLGALVRGAVVTRREELANRATDVSKRAENS